MLLLRAPSRPLTEVQRPPGLRRWASFSASFRGMQCETALIAAKTRLPTNFYRDSTKSRTLG